MKTELECFPMHLLSLGKSITNRTLKFIIIYFFYPFFTLHKIWQLSNFFYKDDGKIWLSVTDFLGVITFHLYCYSDIKRKNDDY